MHFFSRKTQVRKSKIRPRQNAGMLKEKGKESKEVWEESNPTFRRRRSERRRQRLWCIAFTASGWSGGTQVKKGRTEKYGTRMPMMVHHVARSTMVEPTQTNSNTPPTTLVNPVKSNLLSVCIYMYTLKILYELFMNYIFNLNIFLVRFIK